MTSFFLSIVQPKTRITLDIDPSRKSITDGRTDEETDDEETDEETDEDEDEETDDRRRDGPTHHLIELWLTTN